MTFSIYYCSGTSGSSTGVLLRKFSDSVSSQPANLNAQPFPLPATPESGVALRHGTLVLRWGLSDGEGSAAWELWGSQNLKQCLLEGNQEKRRASLTSVQVACCLFHDKPCMCL